MAVQEQTPYIEYVGNGVTKSFATVFACESKEQLSVLIDDQIASNWTYENGVVIFTTAPVLNNIIKLKRKTKLERTTNYQSFNNSLNPKTLNTDFDRVWYAMQDLNYKVNQYDLDYDFVLNQVRPVAAGGTGANNTKGAQDNLGVYSKEEVDALIATGGQGNIVPIGGGGTGASTEKEARTNLNVPSKTEMTTAIADATPDATEMVAGKVRIATGAEVQAGIVENTIVTPKTLKESVFAFGVDWRDVSASRAINTNYVNTLPRTIIVRICFFITAAATFTSLQVGGKSRDAAGAQQWATNSFVALSAEVPSGKTFRFDVPTGSVSQLEWGEL